MEAPPITHLHRDEPAYSWELIARPALPVLSPFVSRYDGYVQYAGGTLRHRQYPHPRVVLIVTLEDQLGVATPGDDSAAPAKYTAFMAGLHETRAITEFSRRSSGVQVNLTPLGAYRFRRMPMHSIANRVIGLEDLLGTQARILVERLRATQDWETRFQLMDAAILRRLVDGPAPTEAVGWAWSQIERSGGQANIAGLAHTLNWSPKRLISAFREEVGLTPKTAARIVRFSGVMDRLPAEGTPCWAEVAADAGYYDQAHFNREFAEFTGGTPSDYLRLRVNSEGGGVLDE